jgi:hypothetical protein
MTDSIFIHPLAEVSEVATIVNGTRLWHQTQAIPGVSIGVNTTIVYGVTLENYCMIAAGRTVTKDIEANALVIDSPVIDFSDICKCGINIKDNKTLTYSLCS